jgi:hypothetical protein
MRFVAVLALAVSVPGFAQELDINGYSNVVVPRSQGDFYNYNAGVREAARDAGFELHRSVEEIPREDWPKTLYMTGGMNFRTFTPYVMVYDVVLQASISGCAWDAERRPPSPLGRTSDRAIAAMLSGLIDDLGYRGFDRSAYEANLRARNLVTTASESPAASTAPVSPNRLRMSCGPNRSTDEPADSNREEN